MEARSFYTQKIKSTKESKQLLKEELTEAATLVQKQKQKLEELEQS
jgi:hypothetical protein